jgi:hypothetical protein
MLPCFDPFSGHLQAYKNTGASSWIASMSNMDPFWAYIGFLYNQIHLNSYVVQLNFKASKLKLKIVYNLYYKSYLKLL